MADHSFIEACTAASYQLIPVSALYINYKIIQRIRTNRMRPDTKQFATGLFWMLTAVFIRIEWFVLSRLTAPDSALHNPIMWDLKWLMAIVAGSLFIYGGVTMLAVIEKRYKREYIPAVAGVILVAIATYFV